MIIRVDLAGRPPGVVLEEPDVMTQFHLAVVGEGTGAPSLAEVVGQHGMTWRDDHVFVPRDALVTLAGASVTPAWIEALDGMVGYATSKGWTDDTGALQAHVERS